jgi:trehalose 6-phosphate synthase
MRLTVRLLLAIWLPATVVFGVFAYVAVEQQHRRATLDLERRAWLLGESLKEAVEPLLVKAAEGQKLPATATQIDRIIGKFGTPGLGVAVYDGQGRLLVVTPEIGPALPSALPFVLGAIQTAFPQKGFLAVDGRNTYCYSAPLFARERPIGVLAIFYDATGIERERAELVRSHAIRFAVLVSALSFVVLLVVQASVRNPLGRMALWARQLRAGPGVPPPGVPDPSLFGPLATEVTGLARSLARAQAATEREAWLRLQAESVWTEERLKQFASARLGGRTLVVVSNREPVSHVWVGRRVEAQIPASGVVTAIEPIMRACGGVWVAHGSGDADRETVDERGTVGLPVDNPRYTLKRVWLSAEEEAGYYYGLANEGLWPLCHIVHARPTFRSADWLHYRAVNEKFADAVLAEIADVAEPAILIQDYHFALLPRLLKEKRPDAQVALFWHIPWPNPEAFGICPWQPEILEGMLGADLVGFHTQFHCNNFLDTVDRVVEARLDREHFSVVRGAHTTQVKPYPISVAPEFLDEPPRSSRGALLAELGLSSVEFLGVGVERIDYTKGLPERFEAIRRFFALHPEYRRRLTFVQLAAPSRSRIPRYRALEDEVEELVAAVNADLQAGDWRPILFLKGHHDHRTIWPFYRWADFCMVTSLHDGMNLVAKEFVSVRDDEDGALILSRFTGAARELRDAILVNPYDVDETAEAIRLAVEMTPGERRSRMARMRRTVREHNIYRWAGLLLADLSRLPAEDGGARAVTPR